MSRRWCRRCGGSRPTRGLRPSCSIIPSTATLPDGVQIAAFGPYSEIRDNLIDAAMRPIDILRFKLAFFGATRFDPRSDRWVRITLFQGSPFPDELDTADWDLWPFAA